MKAIWLKFTKAYFKVKEIIKGFCVISESGYFACVEERGLLQSESLRNYPKSMEFFTTILHWYLTILHRERSVKGTTGFVMKLYSRVRRREWEKIQQTNSYKNRNVLCLELGFLGRHA
jgi:hypothetical protein